MVSATTTINTALFRSVTTYARDSDGGNFYDVHSDIVPAYVLKSGTYNLIDIENFETGNITTIVEYKKPSLTVHNIVRSYSSFINGVSAGTNTMFQYDKQGSRITVKWVAGGLYINNKLMVLLGFSYKEMKKELYDVIYAETSVEPTEELLQHCTLYVDAEFSRNPMYTALYKNFLPVIESFIDLPQESYTVIKNLDAKVWKTIDILPRFKKPRERVDYINDLVNLLVDVEEEEVEQVVEPTKEDTVVKVEVKPVDTTDWTPEGWDE